MPKISQLTTLATGSIADGDYIPIVDVSAGTTKKVTANNFTRIASSALGANQIPYANSAGELQGSSALTFDGSTLTVGGKVAATTLAIGSPANPYSRPWALKGMGYLGLATGEGFEIYHSATNDYTYFTSESAGVTWNSPREQRWISAGGLMTWTGAALGIGTSSPATWSGAKLVLQTATSTTSQLAIDNVSYAAGQTFGIDFTVAGGSKQAFIRAVIESGAPAATALVLGTAAGGNLATEQLRVSSAGNLGLGVTPYGWGASARCIDLVGNVGFASLGNSDAFVLSNAYYDGSTWRYKSSSIAVSAYRAATGAHTWFTAPSGTAGNAITLTQAMALDANGCLGIGRVSPSASVKLIVSNAGNLGFEFDPTSSSGTVGMLEVYDRTAAAYKAMRINALSYAWHVGASATLAMTLDASGNLKPGTDNSQTLGSSSYRWSVVYAGTGTINTSDAREKTKVSLLEDKEIEAAAALSAEIGKFQFLSSIESKGEDKARIHLGMTVQRAIEIMEKNSLDPMRYAFICYDKWEEEVDAVEGEEGAYAITSPTQKTIISQVEEKVIEVIDGVPTQKTVTKDVTSPVYETVPVVDEDGNPVVNITPATEEELDEEGNVVKEAIPEQVVPVTYQVPVTETVTTWKKKVSKDRYGFRYDQLIMFIAKGLEARFTRAIQGLVG